MGSGLILLLIVGAWLAVLVPMALRSHDTATAASTVDRFSDAMRVLSRRSAGLEAPDDDVPLVPPPAPRQRRGTTAAARRRRVLVVLVLLAVATLTGGIVGPVELLAAHAVADVLLVAFLAWLRSTAVGRAERERRTATGDRVLRHDATAWSPLREWSPTAAPTVSEAPAAAAPVAPQPRQEVVFDQEAFAPASEVAAAPVEAARPSRPARGAQGEPWQPVPVPVPTYVTAARAPRRVLDLSRPAPAPAADDAPASAERSLGMDDSGPELEHILGRRAVGG